MAGEAVAHVQAACLRGVGQRLSRSAYTGFITPRPPGRINALLPMKTSRIVPILAAFLCGQSFAQVVKTPPTTTVATLPVPVIDHAPPKEPIKKPDFKIESTQVKLIDVVESPPMSGLPPVEGTMTLTVHNVADPGLPDPPPPARPNVDDSKVLGGLEPSNVNRRDMGMVAISATVYDLKRTLLRCNIYGGTERREITAWSNIDFNHFCGVGNFEATGANKEVRSYSLMMCIGNENTENRSELLASKGVEYEGPEIPTIPDGAPAFVIQTENPDPETVTLIEDLHALYRAEGPRMAEAAAARQKAYEEKKAYLLANPPKPKNVTVNFWKREKPAATTTPEGGQP